jgi:hypothetical protein
MKNKIKMGTWAPLVLRVDDGAHLHPQATKHKEKKKKELDFLLRLIKLASKLSAPQALSSQNPNIQPVGDGVIARGVCVGGGGAGGEDGSVG